MSTNNVLKNGENRWDVMASGHDDHMALKIN